ncbi:type VI secretion system protein IglI family protein [Francisella sp. SYW-9]|uniref:type VI secretion system protein IglI family protein n=1 Tax=Francisella sp. SYW-9 TaxID=2610888 RepID=UPI00123D5F40|nr:type VI secretion system protein IglI family protein [Francisella sp. SYW-9]
MSKADKELLHLFGDKQDWDLAKRSDFDVLTECTGLIDAREFQAVIDKISEYTHEYRVLDIQLVCIYLQAHFNLNHSADDYVSSLNILADVLNKYDFISPINKKETITIQSTLTLIKNANDAINYYYPDFLDTQQELIIQHLSRILELLSENIEDIDLLELSESKNQLISTVAKYLIKEDKDPEAVEEAPEDVLVTPNVSKQDRYSFAWANLLLKISKFGGLANMAETPSEKFELALLFDSIQTEIDNFNPIKYFPRELGAFLNSITPEVYTEISQIIENSKGSPLWEFMLNKTDVNIQIDPDNKPSNMGDFNIDEILNKRAGTKTSQNDNNQDSYNDNEADQIDHEDDFSSAFDSLDL